MEDELPATGGGVDLLLYRAEANAPVDESGDRLDQVWQRAAETVQSPHHQGVACSKMGERLGETRPVRDGAGCRVGVELLTTGDSERVLLQGEGLIKR